MSIAFDMPEPLPKATLLDHEETGLMLDSKGEYFQRSRKSVDQARDSDPDNEKWPRPHFRSP